MPLWPSENGQDCSHSLGQPTAPEWYHWTPSDSCCPDSSIPGYCTLWTAMYLTDPEEEPTGVLRYDPLAHTHTKISEQCWLHGVFLRGGRIFNIHHTVTFPSTAGRIAWIPMFQLACIRIINNGTGGNNFPTLSMNTCMIWVLICSCCSTRLNSVS